MRATLGACRCATGFVGEEGREKLLWQLGNAASLPAFQHAAPAGTLFELGFNMAPWLMALFDALPAATTCLPAGQDAVHRRRRQ